MKKHNDKWLEDFLIRSTWATNAIEGNSLTQVQTMAIITNRTIFLNPGKAAEVRLHDIKEVENGEKAFNAMLYYLGKQWSVNEELIKIFNHEITKGLVDRSGQWKIYENQIQGASFKTVGAKETPKAIAELLKWYREELIQTNDLIKLVADFHVKFETIHPFEDGNGRTGRLLLNYQLMSLDHFPVTFPLRLEYLDLLSKSQGEAKNWQEVKAPEEFIVLIKDFSKEEKNRHDIFKNEEVKKITQEYYEKSNNDGNKEQ